MNNCANDVINFFVTLKFIDCLLLPFVNLGNEWKGNEVRNDCENDDEIFVFSSITTEIT